MKVANRDMAQHVRAIKQFTNTNDTVWTNWEGKFYTVYSYGSHFPMYAYDTEAQAWYGNEDKFSRTTTTHQRLARPVEADKIKWVGTEILKDLLNARSTSRYVAHRLTN